ncbi:hypothetical protein GX50_06961 [[Emmonsia] crescens]|uniref:Uncharacterized protein n=1 Tax=[Emmonsia] crescens TaxID=73230 RepID=A0A2B7Z1P2_9EURO|nr:hypothetical protein GX50_06961 [Emmonsia crescens]
MHRRSIGLHNVHTIAGSESGPSRDPGPRESDVMTFKQLKFSTYGLGFIRCPQRHSVCSAC